jgi:TRAP-type C4-dicarboxylate transport system permease small subunit
MWLHLSLSWIEEIQLGLFVWVVFLAAGLTITRNIHLGFSALSIDSILPPNGLPGCWAFVLSILLCLACLVWVTHGAE